MGGCQDNCQEAGWHCQEVGWQLLGSPSQVCSVTTARVVTLVELLFAAPSGRSGLPARARRCTWLASPAALQCGGRDACQHGKVGHQMTRSPVETLAVTAAAVVKAAAARIDVPMSASVAVALCACR